MCSGSKLRRFSWSEVGKGNKGFGAKFTDAAVSFSIFLSFSGSHSSSQGLASSYSAFSFCFGDGFCDVGLWCWCIFFKSPFHLHRLCSGFVVHPFTWFQKRQGSFNVKESDHSPILLNTEVLDSMKRPFFPYDSRWDKDEECAEVVKQAWQLNVRGSDLFKVQQKMTNCRVELLKWRS
ncbi:hypothetical protein J1N35_043781 [Gossypium stocksii]|uniref:Uncharacterized protein n=1 Tax=Gossypium stocksii TaxID=47602 RepID=A0A9D3U7Z2_9ROSI|nr:hypothetical protein J1N35_043781 [Gossypium stocksii]